MPCPCQSAPTQSSVFLPEFCFDTPLGKMCFPILSSPTFPGPPVQADGLPGWTVVRGQRGEISRAAAYDEGRLDYESVATTTAKHRRIEQFYSIGGDPILTVLAEVGNPARQDLRQQKRSMKLSFKGAGLDYRIEMAQTGFALATLTREVDGKVTEHDLDMLDPATCQATMPKTSAFSDALLARIEPFKPVMLAVADAYWAQARADFGRIATSLTGGSGTPPAAASIWCGVARAGCWGLAAAGGGACCVGTAAVGCALCAGGFGAAGSACSEAWSWC